MNSLADKDGRLFCRCIERNERQSKKGNEWDAEQGFKGRFRGVRLEMKEYSVVAGSIAASGSCQCPRYQRS